MAKNKIAFVDGSIARPSSTDLLHSQWVRCNSMVVSWLRNSVILDISSIIMYLDDAYQIWNGLKDRFSLGNLARIYQLKQQLLTQKQGSDAVGAYYTKLCVPWDEFKDFQPARWCICDHCRCYSAKKWSEGLCYAVSYWIACELFTDQSTYTVPEQSGSMINAVGFARGKGGKGKFLCTKCGKTNHTVDKCFEIIGYPPCYDRVAFLFAGSNA
ncbi:uncharacterized protein LOC131011234 isoform X2 [Salvia miltiorrhiza]|uniref:uncharacterized protein LOC131011234 isoform X2 n=1 Tax=Salvia miltiorrhiza TaxID=226208 RepID=UPI0025ABD87A|nr:uncharacterized protein LOC131011234 isoform X2 [Salvia miltiorrhiza]